METFQLTRIYADENGESHFEDKSIPLLPNGDIGFLSAAENTKSIIFRKVKPDYDFDFHHAPQKQYIILLDGIIEIENSIGDKRTFKGGDILLVEDTWGKGHRTKNLQPSVRSSIFITL